MVKAYLADAATPERLADYMAWREAACTLAFIVGPTLGGALFTGASLGACIGVTGWASVAAAGLVLAFVRESRPEEKDSAEEEKDGAEEETVTVMVTRRRPSPPAAAARRRERGSIGARARRGGGGGG